MPDKVEIYNASLVNIGLDPTIITPADDSTEARAINSVYNDTRDELFEERDFEWTRAFTPVLSYLADPNPNTEFTFWYKKPDYVLRIRRIDTVRRDQSSEPLVEFDDDTQGAVFATDLSAVVLEYTKRITSESKFHADFSIALGWAVSAKIALAMTKDPGVAQFAAGQAAGALGKASKNVNTRTQERGQASWHAARMSDIA